MKSEQRHREMEERRLQAAALLEEGLTQAEVARRVGVSRQSVMRWARALEQGGRGELRSTGRTGPKAALSDEQCRQLAQMMEQGPHTHGFVTELWTAGRARTLIERHFGVRLSESQVWRILRGRLGWSCQRPARRAREQDAEAVARWKNETWPRLRRIAEKEGRTIVFVDESGLSQRPTRARTWSPRGQTPVLEFNFNWKTLSAVAGVSFYRFYFRLFDGSIKAPQVVEFLKHLHRHVSRPMLIVWDGLASHRSRLVADYVERTDGAIRLAFLPAYSPELNPVEFLWGHWKNHEVANLCAESLHQLSRHARNALRRMQRRPKLIRAFWVQAELPL